jgi:hypothetical protein
MLSKRIFVLVSLLLVSFLLVGCGLTTPDIVDNQAPNITSTAVTEAEVGILYTYYVEANDPDGDALTYSLIRNPSGMEIDEDTGVITWTPNSAGSFGVTVKVSDGVKSDTQPFIVTVTGVVELTGITVDPKTMTLFVGESKAIKSVTAYYKIKGFGVPIPLEYCTYTPITTSPYEVVKVSDDGVVTAVGEGTATITVEYKDKTAEITVTVSEPVVKTITIRWLEDAVRYNADGSPNDDWVDDQIPPLVDPEDGTPRPPATLIQDGGGYYFADIFDYFNKYALPDTKGSVVIDETGVLSGWATYTLYGLPTENSFVGEVDIVIYDKWFVQYTDYIAHEWQ